MGVKTILKVTEEYGKPNLIFVDNARYKSICVESMDSEIRAYIPESVQVSVGDYISVSDYSLTSDTAKKFGLALLIKEVEPFDKNDPAFLTEVVVDINGELIKPPNREVRMVGKNKDRAFYSATMKIDDSRGSKYNILIVSFFNVAKTIYSFENNSVISLRGKLRKCRDVEGYEINVMLVTK